MGLLSNYLLNRRFNDPSANRIVHAPTVRIADTNGVNADEVADALSSGAKAKKKAYRRSDSSNSVGGRSRGHTKELALPPDDSLMCPPSFLTGLKPQLEIRDGSKLELSVSVKGDPDPQVTWTKDGKAISSSEIMEVKYKNGVATVVINEVFPEDAGRYTCRATNTKGSVETSSKVVILPMEKRVANGGAGGLANGLSSSKHPKVTDHVKSQTVEDGDRVTFTANINGGDKFDVVWLHNEKEIKPSKDFEYKSSGSQYSLIITEVFPEDRGTYTCEAFNDSGECYTTCSLEVNVPGDQIFNPVFKRFPTSLTVDKGGSASFEAELDSAPATIAWMKDGKEMKEQSMKYRMRSQGGKVGLDILECSQADAGQYAVIVTNNKGESKAAFSLNVF